MTLTMGLAVYFTMWWIVLVAVLPFGVRSQHETQEYALGTDPGAPTAPLMVRKVIWTSIISAGLFCALWAYMSYFD